MMEELKIDDTLIDVGMANANKTIDINKIDRFPYMQENLFITTSSNIDGVANSAFDGWKNSPGHNGAMVHTLNEFGESHYISCGLYKNPNTGAITAVYNAIALDWIEKIPELDLNTTDGFIRYQMENYYMIENRNPSAEELLNLEYRCMAELKYLCTEKLDVQVVNDWFMENFGLDISGVGNMYKTCTEKATGKTFEYDSDEWYTTTWMPWQEWLELYTQGF